MYLFDLFLSTYFVQDTAGEPWPMWGNETQWQETIPCGKGEAILL